uniref:ATP synthase CF0 subunit I n=1 Tax=Oryza nivara TaxID=4536 RepID=A0A0E0GS53_ORYNI
MERVGAWFSSTSLGSAVPLRVDSHLRLPPPLHGDLCLSNLHLGWSWEGPFHNTRILSTIRNSEELRRGTIEQLEKARIRLQKVELEADEYRMNGYSEIEREKANLINATSISLEQLEKSKNETLYFEKQRAMNQVRQRVFQQAVQGALGTLNSCLNTELHFRTIRANISILGAMEWKS